MNQIKISILAASAAAILAVGTASAQAQITNVIVSGQKDGATAQPVLPVNTKSVWVTFEYQRAGDSEITVEVAITGGTNVFLFEDTYTGSGTASVEVTGAGIYTSIMTNLANLADATEGALAKIASQQQIRQYAGDTANYVGQMEGLESLVSATEYPGLNTQTLSSLVAAVDVLGELKDEMMLATEDEAKRAKAAEMTPHVAAAAAAIDSLKDAAGPEFPIPPSPAATGGASYLVNIEVDGFPSKDTDFWIWGDTTSELAPGGAGTTPPEGGVVGGPAARATGTPSSGEPADGTEEESAAGVSDAPRQGNPLVAPVARSTATALSGAAAAEKTGQPAGSVPGAVPLAQGAPGDGSAEISENAALPTDSSYVVQGEAVPPPGVAGGAAGQVTPLERDGPNFAMLLVGVVVLAGVAVFMKGRM